MLSAMAEWFFRGWELGYVRVLAGELGYVLLPNKDYGMAVALWQAELDDSGSETEASGGACRWSAVRLAYCYFRALGVDRDDARALELYTHAAVTDENSEAMYALYQSYSGVLDGWLGHAVDHARAVSWIRRSADSGHYEACFRLGCILEDGHLGVDVNLNEALRCYEKAEEVSPFSYTDHIARVRAAIILDEDYGILGRGRDEREKAEE